MTAPLAALVLVDCAFDAGTTVPGAPPHHVEGGFRNVPRIADVPLHALVLDRLRLVLLPNPAAQSRLSAYKSVDARRAWDALLAADPKTDAVLWIGHATVLIRLGGKTVLTDPVFADYVTPAPPFGPRRLVPPGIAIDDLPRIDAILVSHNHYDHFEPAAIRRIAERDRPLCLLPLRVGEGDLGCGRTRRLDWGGAVQLSGVIFRFMPARHDSGRGLFDQKKSLWGSWLIEAGRRRVYFAGDTGYGPHFAAIGARHRPIALAILPVAAYRPRIVNRDVHLDPEGALRAFRDLGAERMLAIHWGTFAMGEDHAFAARADVPRAAAAVQLGADRVWVLENGAARRF